MTARKPEIPEEWKRLNFLPIGFIRCSNDGTILHVNRAFQLIMDCDETGMVCNKNLKDFYIEPELFTLHLDQLTDGRPGNFERVSLRTCKGSEIVCRITGYRAPVSKRSSSYIEFAIEDSSRELMLENRLLQAQKLETIGALAGGIAHDFNNILATISGYAELLQNDLPRSSQSSREVSGIRAAVAKARSLTNQILTFSRQVEQEKVPVNVAEVLRETISFMRSGIPSGISLRSNIRVKDAPVLADPTQLFRVFLNLLTNAVQAMEEMKGIISVSMSLVSGNRIQKTLHKAIVADEYVLVTFRDQGKGMEPSLLRRIFEPFFTTREVGKGLGLGLSVVHGIVSEMGGEVLASSRKGAGSVFYIYLPVNRDATGFNPHEKKRKIVFITRNKPESRILSLALGSAGYELVQTEDRRHLIRLMTDNATCPDLIIIVSDSENITTDDLVRIYQNYQLNVPCILITEQYQDFSEENLLNSGIITQHLIKPVSLKEIKNAIQLSIS